MSESIEKNTVAVRIFGQEYSISGEMSREHIIRIADFVNGKMNEISAVLPEGSLSSVAVLAAVNIGDEFFKQEDEMLQLKLKNQDLEKDAQHYVQLWDEIKSNFAQYKEDMAGNIEQREDVRREFQEKEKEVSALIAERDKTEKHNQVLRQRIEDLSQELLRNDNSEEENESVIKELETKCRDIESSFFDIQMENIHLKTELENLKKDG
jgi:cell division protein ZapA